MLPNFSIDLVTYFSKMKTYNACFIKRDVPTIHELFPVKYTQNTDLDILVSDTDADDLICFSEEYINLELGKGSFYHKCLKVEFENNTRFRIQRMGILNIQFDLQYSYYCNGKNAINDILGSRVLCNGIYSPSPEYEILIRLNEVQRYPWKDHHRIYILGNRQHINIQLIKEYGLSDTLLSLFQGTDVDDRSD